MARLTAHVARLTAQQSVPPPRNLMPSPTPSTPVQDAGDRPLPQRSWETLVSFGCVLTYG
uniref:Uncharacterized protein n=1 Tax=Romanomermis culicivorax TaxID=13658 RepID=A0A915K9R3_ROMCU